MGQTTASLELYSAKKIKKVLNTSIKELSADGIYDYLPVPNLKVLKPKSGDKFYIDTPIEIQWSNDSMEVTPTVTIGYDVNLDNNLHGIAAFIPSGDPKTEIGSYLWSPSKSLSNPDQTERIQPSNNYRIHVHAGAYGGTEPVYSSMDGVFTIATRSFELKKISGDVLANKGSYVSLQWESDGAGDYIGIMMMDKTIPGTSPFEPKSLFKDRSVIPGTSIEEDILREPITLQVEKNYYVGEDRTYIWHTDNIPPWIFTASITIYDPDRPTTLIDFSDPFDVTMNYIKISSTSGIKMIGQTDENGVTIVYDTPGFDGISYLNDAFSSLKSVSNITSIPHYDPSSWLGLYMLLDTAVKVVSQNMYKLYTMISSLGGVKDRIKPGYPVAGESFVRVGEKITVGWMSRDVTSVAFYFMKGDQRIFLNNKRVSEKEQYDIVMQKDHLIYTGSIDIPIQEIYYSKEYTPCKIRIEMEDDTSVFDETVLFKIMSGSF